MQQTQLTGTNDKKYLVTYASKYGSTAGIAEAVGKAINSTGASVDILPVQSVTNLAGYNGVLIGSAIYMGQWQKDAIHFVENHQAALQKMPVAYFAGCLTIAVGTEEEKATAQTYCDAPAAIAALASEPGIFAGHLDNQKLNLFEKLAVKAMKAPVGDHRDWDAIETWAKTTLAAF